MPNSHTFTERGTAIDAVEAAPTRASQFNAALENTQYLEEALQGIMDPDNPDDGLRAGVADVPEVLVPSTVNNNTTEPSGFPDELKMGFWKSADNGYVYILLWDKDEASPTRDNAVGQVAYDTSLRGVPSS